MQNRVQFGERASTCKMELGGSERNVFDTDVFIYVHGLSKVFLSHTDFLWFSSPSLLWTERMARRHLVVTWPSIIFLVDQGERRF